MQVQIPVRRYKLTDKDSRERLIVKMWLALKKAVGREQRLVLLIYFLAAFFAAGFFAFFGVLAFFGLAAFLGVFAFLGLAAFFGLLVFLAAGFLAFFSPVGFFAFLAAGFFGFLTAFFLGFSALAEAATLKDPEAPVPLTWVSFPSATAFFKNLRMKGASLATSHL